MITKQFSKHFAEEWVLDIKAVLKESQAKGEIRQAPWVADLMKNYWK